MTNTKGSGNDCPKWKGRRWKRLALIPIDPRTQECLSRIGIFLVNPLMVVTSSEDRVAKKTSSKAVGVKATTSTKCKRCNGGCGKGRKSK